MKTFYDEQGREVPDPTPIEVDVGLRRPIPLGERIRQLVRDENLRRELDEKGVETFEEADDFEDPLDPIDRGTPYEDNFDPEHPGIVAREMEIRSGFVEDVPLERKQKAAEVVAKHKRGRPKADPKAKPEGDVAQDPNT